MPPYASRSSRFLGQALDGLVAMSPILLIFFADALDMSPNTLAIVAIVSSAAYYFLADGLPGGQSLGKRWLGMVVVHAETGEPCTYLQSFVRNLLLALLGPIDWAFIFGERHQRLGDKLAGTIVIVAGDR